MKAADPLLLWVMMGWPTILLVSFLAGDLRVLVILAVVWNAIFLRMVFSAE